MAERKQYLLQIYVNPDELVELRERLEKVQALEDRPSLSNVIVYLLKKALRDLGY